MVPPFPSLSLGKRRSIGKDYTAFGFYRKSRVLRKIGGRLGFSAIANLRISTSEERYATEAPTRCRILAMICRESPLRYNLGTIRAVNQPKPASELRVKARRDTTVAEVRESAKARKHNPRQSLAGNSVLCVWHKPTGHDPPSSFKQILNLRSSVPVSPHPRRLFFSLDRKYWPYGRLLRFRSRNRRFR